MVCVCVCVWFVSISQVIGCEDRLQNDLYRVEWALHSTQTKPNLTVVLLMHQDISVPTMPASSSSQVLESRLINRSRIFVGRISKCVCCIQISCYFFSRFIIA